MAGPPHPLPPVPSALPAQLHSNLANTRPSPMSSHPFVSCLTPRCHQPIPPTPHTPYQQPPPNRPPPSPPTFVTPRLTSSIALGATPTLPLHHNPRQTPTCSMYSVAARPIIPYCPLHTPTLRPAAVSY
eukprot:GFKZ01009457.1.p2 GENE.GFKZ01009457.1~~GFKZ01009457.1.p2  ORF type:complete len:137 (-),score=4.34 GFKZ01009457.1:1494-1880(-)